MKFNISTEDYKNILNLIDLHNIQIIESKCKLSKEYIAENIELNITEKGNFTQDDKFFIIELKYSFRGKSPDKEKPAIQINATYEIVYVKNENVTITNDFFKPFSKFILEMLVWTYFREFIQNTTYRMNLPSLTLPLKRL